ncbi:MAG: hypothetical protein ABI665_22400 [Vicinamibacterales bacterium]
MTALLLLILFLQATPTPAPTQKPVPADTEIYKKVDPGDTDLQAAVKFAIDEQKRQSKEKISLVGIVTAEKAAVSPNFRVCLFADRIGVNERAQVVVSRNEKKKKWELTTWSWGSCR